MKDNDHFISETLELFYEWNLPENILETFFSVKYHNRNTNMLIFCIDRDHAKYLTAAIPLQSILKILHVSGEFS